MKLAIISDPQRGDKDSPLLKEAGNFFDKFLFVPINQIRVDIAEECAVKYGQINLAEYDCVLPIPTFTYKEVFYVIMKVLSKSTYIPMNADRYLLATDEALLFKHLNKNGIKTRDMFVISSGMPIKEILKKTKFPMVVRPTHYKKVVVTNSKTLLDVISLSKVGVPVTLEPPVRAQENVLLFLVGNEIIASYGKKGNDFKPFDTSSELRKLAVKTIQSVGCDYCLLNFLLVKDEWILSKFYLAPDFLNIQKITNKDVARALLEHLAGKSKKVKETKLGEKIFRLFRR